VTVTTQPEPLSADVTDLTASALSATSVKLDWASPDDPNFAGVLICSRFGARRPRPRGRGVTLKKPGNTYTDDSQD
jgi:hypothetical protein